MSAPASKINHGFWNFCPTAYTDIFHQNGWQVTDLIGVIKRIAMKSLEKKNIILSGVLFVLQIHMKNIISKTGGQNQVVHHRLLI